MNSRAWRGAEIPAANGHGNARSVVQAMAPLAKSTHGAASGGTITLRGAVDAMLVVGTDSPDYTTPATSVVLQHKLGAINAGTFEPLHIEDPELKTLQMYIDKINADGGVLGKQLELVHYDVDVSADKARTSTKRLLDDDQVDVIVGGSTTGTTMAAVPLVERAGVPFISLAGAVVIIEAV